MTRSSLTWLPSWVPRYGNTALPTVQLQRRSLAVDAHSDASIHAFNSGCFPAWLLLVFQILLETAFRNYSVLSLGETIVIDIYGATHKLDVVETRPEAAVSLLGTLDLEVDFAPAQVLQREGSTCNACLPVLRSGVCASRKPPV
jgi:hypothetical protein